MPLIVNKQKLIDVLIENKVERVRLSKWNEWAYMKLAYTEDGRLAAFAHLWDVNSPGTIEVPVVIAFTADEDGFWEEWKMPSNYEERFNEIYKESAR